MTATTSYGFGIDLEMPYEQAIERVTAALKEQGFGVLTSIDVKQTLKQKIDADFEPYTILGACNPHLAYRALQEEHMIGLMLPCNVIVHAHGESSRVDIADPIVMLGIVDNPRMLAVAQEAREKLERALSQLR